VRPSLLVPVTSIRADDMRKDRFGEHWRRCACGAPLDPLQGSRCDVCAPELSLEARVAQRAHQIRAEEIVAMEREAELLAETIRKLGRRIYRWR